jgi:hypothetical protein
VKIALRGSEIIHHCGDNRTDSNTLYHFEYVGKCPRLYTLG